MTDDDDSAVQNVLWRGQALLEMAKTWIQLNVVWD
jgi:hypothetical protein